MEIAEIFVAESLITIASTIFTYFVFVKPYKKGLKRFKEIDNEKVPDGIKEKDH